MTLIKKNLILTLMYVALISQNDNRVYAVEHSSVNSGLFSKELTQHNDKADISFYGDKGLKKDNFYDLTGHVFIKQDTLSLSAKKARLYFLQKDSKYPQSAASNKFGNAGIEHAFAKGDVKIVKTVSNLAPEFRASADEAEFLLASNTLVLKGQAKFWRADEFIHAEIISIDLNTNDISFKEPRGSFAGKNSPNSISQDDQQDVST